ncbi:MAG: HAMP domain-containing histidine kinase [Kiritimatiellales bacterium]|nr:HAMP domain-containing histidine kinase [Kiritimatiellales bacterium]MCF7864491.1 HAMP domain-containing histidine kinase [Kiritimatiellales bacterium]
MKQAPIRIRYFSQLTLLLLASYILFFGILCLVEFRKAYVDPTKMAEASHEVAIFFIVGFVSLPLALLLAWHMTRRLLQPLHKMVQTAEQIGNGDFSKRIQLNRTYDDLDQLATSFNLAFDRYEDAVEKLKHFGADAAHQLRTPLTSIRSVGEITLLKTRSPEEYEECLHQILEDIHDLSITIDQLLLLARLETGSIQRSFEKTALEDSIIRAADRFQPLLDEKKIGLIINATGSSFIFGAPALIDQVFANLLDNAIRFTSSGGHIWIALENINQQVRCTFEDSGTGISDAMLQHVFERFQRDKSSDTSGSGLGLAIVKNIVDAHQGTIEAGTGSQANGARFIMCLPALP